MNISAEGKLQKVIKWISQEKDESPDQSYQQLINKAVLRFDLSPLDTDFITEFYRASRSENRQR
ncbi:MAG TPA: hypothetical protein PKZ12_05340 [Smithellaceae bacterium]|nr:hypothetical protein [Smithellaceae bacterium]